MTDWMTALRRKVSAYPEHDLRIGLRLKREPLVDIEDSQHEWWLGTLSISKLHPEWRSGHAHPLKAGARFYKQWFEFGDQRGWAVVFRPQDPPAPEVGDFFVGWVEVSRESEADRWLDFLNKEIAMRVATQGEPRR